MKSANWIRALAVTAVLASACGSAPTPTAEATPSPTPVAISDPSPTPTNSPTPRATPRPTPRATPKATPPPQANPCPPVRATAPVASNPNLALVTLSNGCPVVRDITDINHARSVGSLEGWVNFPPQFVSATAISYMDTRGLVRTPLSGSPRTRIAGRGAYFFAWSPDGKTAAYLTSGFGTKMQLHLVSAGKDRLVSSMPGLPSVFGCESQTCGDGWDFHLSYSPDGRFITWAQNITDVFRMWTANGVDVTPKTPFIEKTIWSGSGFYFQDSKGIEVWRSGVISTFLPRVSWIRPKASPGGGQIVYETRDSAGVARTYVVDTATAKVRGLGAWRAEPAFLTSRFIWDQGERSCKANECPSGSAIGSGHTYIYDLLTGTETESVITSVLDVWPHPA